jgi:hypothetical protein
MLSTTLRINDELAVFLQEAAREQDLSVNAFLVRLLEEKRAEARRRRLAEDWAAYAADPASQDVAYALAAQGELMAEPDSPAGNVKARKGSGNKR